MEIALFMALIGFASVFVMMSLGYSNKNGEGTSGNDGYVKSILNRFLGQKTNTPEQKTSYSPPLNAWGMMAANDEKKRLRQKHLKNTVREEYGINRDMTYDEVKDTYARLQEDCISTQNEIKQLEKSCNEKAKELDSSNMEAAEYEKFKTMIDSELDDGLDKIMRLKKRSRYISECLEELDSIKQKYESSENEQDIDLRPHIEAK